MIIVTSSYRRYLDNYVTKTIFRKATQYLSCEQDRDDDNPEYGKPENSSERRRVSRPLARADKEGSISEHLLPANNCEENNYGEDGFREDKAEI